jgi:hypothetical protein
LCVEVREGGEGQQWQGVCELRPTQGGVLLLVGAVAKMMARGMQSLLEGAQTLQV